MGAAARMTSPAEVCSIGEVTPELLSNSTKVQERCHYHGTDRADYHAQAAASFAASLIRNSSLSRKAT